MGTVVMSAAREQGKLDVGSTVGEYQLVKRIDGVVANEAFVAKHRSGEGDAVFHVRHFAAEQRAGVDQLAQAIRDCQQIAHPCLAATVDVLHGGDRVGVLTRCSDNHSNDSNTLAEIVACDGAVPAELVYSIIRQVALALKSIHDSGHSHLALEPRTVFLQADGDVQVLGLGAAMLRRDQHSHTPRDPHQDLCALGRVAQFLLAGDATRELDTLPPAWKSILQRWLSSEDHSSEKPIDQAIRDLDHAFDPSGVEKTQSSEPCPLLHVDSDSTSQYRTDTASPSFRSWLLASCRQLFQRR